MYPIIALILRLCQLVEILLIGSRISYSKRNDDTKHDDTEVIPTEHSKNPHSNIEDQH